MMKILSSIFLFVTGVAATPVSSPYNGRLDLSGGR
jgi:hypothetical protein